MTMRAVILAAGKGTRMRGLCERTPKPLLPVANVPLLELTITRLRKGGVGEVLLVIGHGGDHIQQHFGDGARCGVKVSYAWQHDPRGTGQAASLAEEFAQGEPFALLFGDILASAANYPALLSDFDERRPDLVLTVYAEDDPCAGAAVYVDGRRVTKIIEKPKPGTSTTRYNSAGLFVFSPDVFDELRKVEPSVRGEYELTDAIHAFIAQGRRVEAFDLSGYWMNLTDPEAYVELNGYVSREIGTDRDRAVTVGDDCRIGAASIGPNACLGAGCVVEDGASIRDAVVLPDCHIGERATMEHVVVQAGTVVPPGRSLVGSRAQVAVVGPADLG